MQHIAETQELLAQVFTHYKNVACWASGGKDSTVLLHLLRPWADRVTVLSVIMDNGFPGVQECLEDHCRAWGFTNLQIMLPPISFPQYIQNFGWPAQLIPTAMDGPLLDPFYDGGPKLSSWWHCSVLRVIWPLMQASQEAKVDAVLTASRKSDAPAHGRIGPVIEAHDVGIAGWTRYDMLHQWSTDQIWSYIDTHDIALPPLYQWKRHMLTDAPDCIDCPFSAEYVTWTKEHDPVLYERIMTGFRPALKRMQALAMQELAKWEGLEP